MDVLEDQALNVLETKPWMFEQDVPGQGHYLSMAEVCRTAVRGIRASVSADLGPTTMSQPVLGKGDWGVDVIYCA